MTRNFYSLEEAIEENRILSTKKRANEEEEEEEEAIVVVVEAGVAAELNRNEKFDECIKVGKWWQQTHSEWLHKGLKVSVICPHLTPKLDKD